MKRPQTGAAAVEFALVMVLLFMLIFGILDFGRALFQWNSAADATRRGARTAAIVNYGDSAAVLAEMQVIMPQLTSDDVTIEYSGDGTFAGAACGASTCRFVRVSLNMTFTPVIFFLPVTIQMPPFTTTYPIEALGST